MRVIKHSRDLVLIILGAIMAVFLKMNPQNREVWLISERRDEAEDNGYYLFKYIRETHPEKKAFYVIDKKSPAYQKIKQYGNAIHHNSLSHYTYYFLAEKHLSAFQFFGVPETPFLWKLEKWGIIKKKKVFLQHGITKEMLPFLHHKNTNYRLFVCGAKPEYDYIKSNFGYPDENVKYLGFCRFDYLHGFNTKKQILIMPTWRQWFGLTNKDSNRRNDYSNFVESDYFKTYSSLLSDSRLHYVLKSTDTRLVFYPHPEMQRFIHAFNIADSKNSNIIIADRKTYNLQELLKESQLLITDYSSVAFDFAYMKKPLIYYQFDQEAYYSNHFQKGYFDCSRDGFGPVIKEKKKLIEEINKVLNGFVVQTYLDRSRQFFLLNDQQNCKRHFEVIRNI